MALRALIKQYYSVDKIKGRQVYLKCGCVFSLAQMRTALLERGILERLLGNPRK